MDYLDPKAKDSSIKMLGMRELLIATTNRGKVIEIRHALDGLNLTLLSLSDLPSAPPVVEDADTFEGNARKKALHYARWSGKPTLTDDSGLVVDALGGQPGVHSARYAGDNATDEDNRQKLLRELKDVPEEKRGAAFVCCLVVVTPGGQEMVVEGRCEGRITFAPKGTNGFGYDPLFFYPPLGRTTAELSLEEKNQISHRGRALEMLRRKIEAPTSP